MFFDLYSEKSSDSYRYLLLLILSTKICFYFSSENEPAKECTVKCLEPDPSGDSKGCLTMKTGLHNDSTASAGDKLSTASLTAIIACIVLLGGGLVFGGS